MRPGFNQNRCTRKLAATLRQYQNNEKANTDSAVVDMLTDLRHVCDRYGLDYASLNRIARGHHIVERTQDRELMTGNGPGRVIPSR